MHEPIPKAEIVELLEPALVWIAGGESNTVMPQTDDP